MTDAQQVARAHAFARVLGYFLTDGSVSLREGKGYNSSLYMGHRIDAAQAVADIQLAIGGEPCGVREPTADCNTFRVYLPAALLRDLHQSLGIQPGKRVLLATSLPEFVLAPDCPKSFVREFLGGLFGGDGHTPGPCSSNSWNPVAFSMSKVAEHQTSIALVFGQIKKLLARFDIRDTTEYALDDVTNNHANSVVRPGVRVLRGLLRLSLGKVVPFHERIGFRLCAHKQQRLNVAAAFLRAREYSREQRCRFIDQVKDLTGYDTAKISEGGRRILKMPLTDACKLTQAEMAESEVYINENQAIPSYINVLRVLTKYRTTEKAGTQSFGMSTTEWLAEVGASAFFSDLGISDEEVRDSRILFWAALT